MFLESLKGLKYQCGFSWSREVSESKWHSGSALNKGWVFTEAGGVNSGAGHKRGLGLEVKSPDVVSEKSRVALSDNK